MQVSIEVDGESIEVAADISLAAALLELGGSAFRTHPIDHSARAPHCMMGVCYECLVEVEGRGTQRACQIEATEGMRIRRKTPRGEQ